MKRLVLISICLAVSTAFGQQISLNSQYMFNETSFNPGAVGSKEYIQIHLNGRRQWAGFEGAPATESLTANAYLGKNFGIGGSLFNDVTGPSRRTGGMIMGAYRLPLSSDGSHTLGMGLGVSFTQHIIDVNRLTTYLPDDPAILKGYNDRFVPDANVGFFYTFKDKGFVGISGRNLIQSDKDLFDFDLTMANPMVRNYYLYGGYNFALPKNWGLKPTAMVRMIEAMAIQFDVSLLASYKQLLWFGVSYRHDDAVVGMAGFQFSAFKIGYSYDYTLSEIGDYSTGSHELFLELQIFKSDKKAGSKVPWLKRNRIYGPSI